MAHEKSTAAAATLGDALALLHIQAGSPAYRSIARALIITAEHPDLMPADNTIRRMHQGDVDPWTCPIEHLIALAKFYGVNSTELGPDVAARVGDLLATTQNWKMMSTEGTRRDPQTGRFVHANAA